MRKPLLVAVSGLAGVTATGLAVSLLAWPAQAGDAQAAFKREQDTPDVVLVADDDEPDEGADDIRARADDDTRPTRTDRNTDRNTRTGNTRADRSRTGTRSGRDNSRTGRAKADWTRDGGDRTRDWTANSTNDRSRNNTRGR